METITKKDFDAKFDGVTIDTVRSIKADSESTESKQVTLRFHLEGVSLRDVLTNAISTAVVKWQNGPGRKQFDQWTQHQVIDVDFKSPGKKIETPEEIMAKAMTLAKGMNQDALKAYIESLESLTE